MRIGYSAWGFCGEGIADSPDGGRLTRSLFISRLIRAGYEVVWLQQNRDLDVFGNPIFSVRNKNNFTGQKSDLCDMTYDTGFPDIDILFLEWRWPIQGRNTGVSTDDPNYTPDLDRQKELISYYTTRLNDPMLIVWDKDETMTIQDEESLVPMSSSRVRILSPALYPKDLLYHRETMLFPCDLNAIRGTKVNSENNIDYLLGYVGSQYDRDYQVYTYVNPFARDIASNYMNCPGWHGDKPVVFAGNWTKNPEKYKRNVFNFPDIKFIDRILPSQMNEVYGKCLATLLMCKKNYAEHGHITQRIHEAPANGMIAIGLREQKGIDNFILSDNIITDAYDLKNCVKRLMSLSLSDRQREFDRQVELLEPFDIENVFAKFQRVVNDC